MRFWPFDSKIATDLAIQENREDLWNDRNNADWTIFGNGIGIWDDNLMIE